MKKKVVPYNTGKVLIGVNYTPKPELPTDEPSRDMFRLQRALTDTPKPTAAETWMMRVVLVFCSAIVLLDLFVWRP